MSEDLDDRGTQVLKLSAVPINIMDFCTDMNQKKITANWEYQRSNKVWPKKAQSLLIDTILNGYPVPKLMIWQRLDLNNMSVHKEIVDGQQRATAILAFFNGELSLTGNVTQSGATFEELPGDLKARFLNYDVQTDIITGVGEKTVREIFWRMNSYTVPLNPQERRHAMHFGEMKQFILDLARMYTSLLVEWGTFTTKQTVRMKDAEFLAELTRSLLYGIQTHSQAKLDQLYAAHEESFREAERAQRSIDYAFGWLNERPELQTTKLTRRREVLLTLLLALVHTKSKWAELEKVTSISRRTRQSSNEQVRNLLRIEEILELDPDSDDSEFTSLRKSSQSFVRASRKATNTVSSRKLRFKLLVKALTESEIPL